MSHLYHMHNIETVDYCWGQLFVLCCIRPNTIIQNIQYLTLVLLFIKFFYNSVCLLVALLNNLRVATYDAKLITLSVET